MKLKLERLNKTFLTNPLVAPKLFPGVWKIGEVREVQDKNGYDILSRFSGLFAVVPEERPAEKKMVEHVETAEPYTTTAKPRARKLER